MAQTRFFFFFFFYGGKSFSIVTEPSDPPLKVEILVGQMETTTKHSKAKRRTGTGWRASRHQEMAEMPPNPWRLHLSQPKCSQLPSRYSNGPLRAMQRISKAFMVGIVPY